jgi:5-methylcytosine-specific restriction endonuclease McrA
MGFIQNDWQALLNASRAERASGGQRATKRKRKRGGPAKRNLTKQETSRLAPLQRTRRTRGNSCGEKILNAISALKDKHAAGRISDKRFWKRYFVLRSSFYYSNEWKELRKLIIARDKTCRCGCKIQEVHHKKMLFTHPNLGLDRKNLVGLCIACHAKEHN